MPKVEFSLETRAKDLLAKAEHNSVIVKDPKRLYEPLAYVSLQCKLCDRQWTARSTELQKDHWCENCQDVDISILANYLSSRDYAVKLDEVFEKSEENSEVFKYALSATSSNDVILFDVSLPGKPNLPRLVARANFAISTYARYAYIDRRLFRTKIKFEEYLASTLVNQKPVTSSSVQITADSFTQQSQVIAKIMEVIPAATITSMRLGRGQLIALGPNSVMTEEIPTPEGKFGMLGYIRLSTVYQTEDGYGLNVQLDQLQGYSTFEKLHIRCFVYDLGVSGTKLDGRPGMQHILDIIKPDERLCVANLSRFARNTQDALKLHSELKRRSAELVITDLKIDTSSMYGELIFTFMSALSAFESKQISQRVSMTMQKKSADGSLRSKAPFGYKFVGKKLPFERVPEEQATIEMIRKMRADNPSISLRIMCEKLQGEKRHSGSRKKIDGEPGEKEYIYTWRENRLRTIMIQNKLLVGKFQLENDVKASSADAFNADELEDHCDNEEDDDTE